LHFQGSRSDENTDRANQRSSGVKLGSNKGVNTESVDKTVGKVNLKPIVETKSSGGGGNGGGVTKDTVMCTQTQTKYCSQLEMQSHEIIH